MVLHWKYSFLESRSTLWGYSVVTKSSLEKKILALLHQYKKITSRPEYGPWLVIEKLAVTLLPAFTFIGVKVKSW